ncbi:hypothetical protein LX32DRAFT_562598 [Colletotrichum zoysiae]|uniref:Uncharacterized protein n=1 Tax=Colletotrichum zoysiae TaxID=1216348 RepID=A0AAD9HIG8_9PEZI|nr:hypothetical protein LX32DRAFT_562598 [Colletotrichum zoysiae]
MPVQGLGGKPRSDKKKKKEMGGPAAELPSRQQEPPAPASFACSRSGRPTRGRVSPKHQPGHTSRADGQPGGGFACEAPRREGCGLSGASRVTPRPLSPLSLSFLLLAGEGGDWVVPQGTMRSAIKSEQERGLGRGSLGSKGPPSPLRGVIAAPSVYSIKCYLDAYRTRGVVELASKEPRKLNVQSSAGLWN